MKTALAFKTVAGSFLLVALQALAQPFSSGSAGSYGPLNVTTNTTLEMPDDGIFHCTTITVASNATLRFNRNPLNTSVFLLATGDVIIQGNIDVSASDRQDAAPGRGGPGGFDGGFGGLNMPHGDGQGPGAGRWTPNDYSTDAAFAFATPLNTSIYGNTLLIPLIGGSGGAASDNPGGGVPPTGGGGGGGAILLSSSTRVTIRGLVIANGGFGFGGGSGGAIRVVAPIVTGNGLLQVGGGGAPGGGRRGSAGRTRIDSMDLFAAANLTLGGKAAKGNRMLVFTPGPAPRLDIVEVAGMSIPAGTNNSVAVNLPAGVPSSQPVIIQASNFTNDVQITLTVTPQNGSATRFEGVIAYVGPVSVGTLNITIPRDVVCYLHAWSR